MEYKNQNLEKKPLGHKMIIKVEVEENSDMSDEDEMDNE